MYYALGNVTGSVASDPTGIADPTTLGGGLAFGNGAGSTAAFHNAADGLGTPGQALATATFAFRGVCLPAAK